MRNAILIAGLVVVTAACSGENASPPAQQPTATPTSTPSAAPTSSPAAAPTSTPAAEPAPPPVAPPSNARVVGTPGATAAAVPSTPAPAEPAPAFREVTIPAGTTLPLTLRTSVASDTSQVEDPIRATLRAPVTVDGVRALPEGTVVTGHVTDAARSAKVKGRARIAFRFTRLDQPGDGGRVTIRTSSVAREAEGTKKQDAAKIGGGAVGGAIIGGIIGGGDGAAKGAAIGGAGGTGVVLATRGKEVRLPAGTSVSVKLTEPLTIRVALR